MMRLFDFPLLLDENIVPEVAQGLVERGCDVQTVDDLGLLGATDDEVLSVALSNNRVVVTHDSDFGTLAIQERRPIVGIIYLRPSHIDGNQVLRQVDAVRTLEIESNHHSSSLQNDEGLRLRCIAPPGPCTT
ncbi:MAG: DUF5615 family PIN-like protein [Myxococcota bacterium]